MAQVKTLLLPLIAVGVTATLLWAQYRDNDRKGPPPRRPDGPPRFNDRDRQPPPHRRDDRGGPGARRFPPPPPPVIEVLDVDRDGEISAAEIKKAPTTLLELDKNKDGKLTRQELRPKGPPHGRPDGPPPFGRPPRKGKGDRDDDRKPPRKGPDDRGPRGKKRLPPPADRIMQLDTNRDGKVTAKEVPANLRATFERFCGQVDTNKDQAVDEQELLRAFRPPQGDRGDQRDGDQRPPRPRRPDDE